MGEGKRRMRTWDEEQSGAMMKLATKILVVFALLATACGSDASTDGSAVVPETVPPVAPVELSFAERAAVDSDAALVAGSAVSDFGFDLFAAMREENANENLAISPLSVAVVLAMLEEGASGEAQTEFREVLGIEDPLVYHQGLGSLEQILEGLVGTAELPSEFRLANSAYVDSRLQLRPEYLDAIGRNYGPALVPVDIASDPEAVRHEINGWVADQTNDLIPELFSGGKIKVDTVLVLVNALYLKASWQFQFDEENTTPTDFNLAGGSTAEVEMMVGESESSRQGDGWVAGSKLYSNGLMAEFLLPDEGRFDEVGDDLASIFAVGSAVDAEVGSFLDGALLKLPKFGLRTNEDLADPLKALGLERVWSPGNLDGLSEDSDLYLQFVQHETFVSMNERETEAAAATAAGVGRVSAGPPPGVPVILDRPFYYRIFDPQTGTNVFVGQVLDPSE